MAGVNVKMGVTGISQFKQNIKVAQNSVKTLDQQLALNEKQFKATGDAEAYMQQKTELLKKKIEEQKSIIAQTEKALKQMSDNGVDKASDAFQSMQRQMLKAKGDLLDAETQLNGIDTAGEKAADGVEDMNRELKNIGKQVSFETVTSGINRITDGLEKAAKTALKVGRYITNEILGAGEYADNINTLSKVLEVNPEVLQRWQKTAQIIDTDAETIAKARQRLERGIGTGTAMDALEALGIKYNGNAEDTFWAAGEAIMALGDDAEQEAKANEIFGKSWHDLIPLFSAGREEFDRINASWNVLTEDELNSLNDMDDEYQRLKIDFEDLKRTALVQFAEPMKNVLEAIDSVLGDIGEWLNSEEGKAMVDNVVTMITDSLQWIVDNKETVVNALKWIIGGWGALKLTGGALQVFQLINGAKNLFFGGAAKGVSGAAAGASGGGGAAAGTGIGAKIGSLLGGGNLAIGGAVAAELGLAVGSLYGLGRAGNKLLFGDQNDENLQWNDTDQAIHDDLMLHGGWSDDMLDEMERLAEADQMTAKSNSEMTQAAGEMKNLPTATAAALRNELHGMQIVMDGEAVGRVVAKRVGGYQAGAIRAMIK